MTTPCVAIATWDWPAFTGGGISSLMHTLAIGLPDPGFDDGAKLEGIVQVIDPWWLPGIEPAP